jgi:hypothetical protein
MTDCVCGHSLESHQGHTYLEGTPAPTYCCRCECRAYQTAVKLGVKEQVFAIIRLDRFLAPDAPTQDTVTVTKVLRSLEAANGEVRRLNGLQNDTDVLYFWQTTRLCERPT